MSDAKRTTEPQLVRSLFSVGEGLDGDRAVVIHTGLVSELGQDLLRDKAGVGGNSPELSAGVGYVIGPVRSGVVAAGQSTGPAGQ
ncbi:hypothetical protein [Streptomyces sp. NBC_00568]|uniref:hypothetical protein n=1 Tax=Streptomyces sp. NBC_00568 TaxID=2975779 RepID=UPI002250506C|nr:hypothetical protein [Streptomyces sp. NBC_00568]MCX4993775.1 hypothetical protein [Streptomyces sp. NBC_00568]